VDEDKAEVMPNIDYIYSAVIADSEALEEAKMTLEIIKKTDPGVYDEMINDTLSMIRKALSSSILSVVDRMVKVEVAAEREACAALCDKISDEDGFEGGYANHCAVSIRERGAPALERLNKAAEDSGEPL
jgi:DNA-binding Lrp family transcriptional regulator